MNETELRKQIALGEDSTRQFKRQATHTDSMAGELVAFCNSGGGKLFLGVDNDGSIIGMEGREAETLGSDLAKIAWDNVRPPFTLFTEAVPTSDGIVLAVTIPEGALKPYCDRSGTYWIKNGPDKRRIQHPSELARLFQSGEKFYAETQTVAESTIDDFNHEKFFRFYENKYNERAPDPLLERESYLQKLANLNFIKGNHITVVGLLLFGRRLPVLLPEMKIDAIWFNGSDKTTSNWLDQREITGTLPEQYDQASLLLKTWNARIQTTASFNTRGTLQIPELVFEELLINALVHRDYFIKDSIKLFIFDDRIEIRSPGKLTNSLTVEQIRRGVRKSRNALLASFAPDLLNYRGIGSGVVRALKHWSQIEWINDTEAEELSAIIRF